MITRVTQDVRRVGTALVGGRLSGTAPGVNAIVIGTPAYAAYGTGLEAIAIGRYAFAPAQEAIAIGRSAFAYAAYAIAIGRFAYGIGSDAIAIGRSANAAQTGIAHIAGAMVTRAFNGGDAVGTWNIRNSGPEIVLISGPIDLKTVADVTLTLPTNTRLYITEVGVILTALTGLTTQPTIRFGISGTPAKHHAAAITTNLTAVGKRELFTPLVPTDGETTISAGVTVAATATTMTGKFYFKGILHDLN